MKSDLGRIGIVSGELSFREAPDLDDAAAELDELGFGAIWIPGGVTGGVHLKVSRMLAATRRCTIATGILNIWKQPADELGAWWREECPDQSRVMLGLGVSHAPLVGKKYGKPLAVMSEYLDELDAQGIGRANRCLAALGPRMLDLAREKSAGAHPYLVPPEHTAFARERLGPDAFLAPEQGVILEEDPQKAMEFARMTIDHYRQLPNYVNNWLRLGFSEEDVMSRSNRLVDALFAWGSPKRIRQRVQEHLDAGANQVCLQVIQGELFGRLDYARQAWRALAEIFE